MKRHFQIENKLKQRFGIVAGGNKSMKKRRSTMPFTVKPSNILASSDDLNYSMRNCGRVVH